MLNLYVHLSVPYVAVAAVMSHIAHLVLQS